MTRTPLDIYFKVTQTAGQKMGQRKLEICDTVRPGPERNRLMDAAQKVYDRIEEKARKTLYAVPYYQWR